MDGVYSWVVVQVNECTAGGATKCQVTELGLRLIPAISWSVRISTDQLYHIEHGHVKKKLSLVFVIAIPLYLSLI